MKRITIKDVAARVGVSCATVSRALADRPEIREETKARVRSACEALGYVPNIAARGLVRSCTQTLGLVVPNISNPYFSRLALSIETTAQQHGYHVILCNSMLDPVHESESILALIRLQVDGLIVAAFSPETQQATEEAAGQTPLIYLGGNHDGNCSYIKVDTEQGAYLGTQYLIGLGHRSIAFVGGHDRSNPSQRRLHGFQRAIREAGVCGVDYPLPPEGDVGDRAYELACRVLDEKPVPGAILAYSDHVALAILRALYERGLRVPEDISLIGFDDAASAGLPRVNLTSVAQRRCDLGALAVSRLMEKIGGNLHQTHDIFEPEIIVRGSCRAVGEPS